MPISGDPQRVNSTVSIPTEYLNRARAAVRIVRRATGRRYTMAQFLREAISAQLSLIARDYNNGREIPPDTQPLDRGATPRTELKDQVDR